MRILVIRHGAFGDIVQTDGALRDIRAHHPRAEITALTTPPYRRLFERCPFVDRVMIDPRASRWRVDLMLSLRRQLRAGRFDLVYDLQSSKRTAWYRRWMLPGVPWSGRIPGRRTTPSGGSRILSAIQLMAAQLRDAGLDARHAEHPDVSWMAADVTTLLREAGVRRPYIVLIPGSSARHLHKRWPFYPQLATALLARGYDVVTAPGPDERDLVRTIPGITLTGPNGFIDWFELAGVFSRAAFVVGNDTGPSHLAAHSGTPGLALFGPHLAPALTGIVRETFEVMAVPDLSGLGVDKVLSVICDRLARGTAARRPSGPNDRNSIHGHNSSTTASD